MLNKLKLFVMVLVMIAVPATMVFAGKAEVDKKEAKAMNNASNEVKAIADDVNPAEEAFKEAAEKLDKYIDKAGKDKKFDENEIKNIDKLADNVDKKAKILKSKCDKVAKEADKLTNKIKKATD